MTYIKPEAVKLDGALSAIQGHDKGPMNLDSNGSGDKNATTNAYESDE
ncbi:MAG: hypothetical protein WAK48_10600 [Candidatus Acidiferrum sp.]|jgi:hypothetical protein